MDMGPPSGYGLAVSDMDLSSARLVPVVGTDGWLARLPGAVVWVTGERQAARELIGACLAAGSPTELLGRTGAHLADPEAAAWPPFALLVSRGPELVAIVHGPVEMTVDQDGEEHRLYGGEEIGSWLNRHLKGTRSARAGKPGDEEDFADLREGVVRASGFVLAPPDEPAAQRQSAPREVFEGSTTSEQVISEPLTVAVSEAGTSDAVDAGTSGAGPVEVGTPQAGASEAESPTVVDQPVAVGGGSRALLKLTWDNGEVYELMGAALVGRDVALDESVISGELAALVPGGQNDSMSRVHAELRPSGRDMVVVDRGSTNGTFVWDDGTKTWQRLPPGEAHVVHLGAVLAFGERTATFEAVPLPAA